MRNDDVELVVWMFGCMGCMREPYNMSGWAIHSEYTRYMDGPYRVH